jgi:acetylornithine deacetylase
MSQTIALLETLVGFDTTSDRSNLEAVDWIVTLLEPLGARIRLSRDGSGAKANILASFGPQGDGGIVLSGHTDVVPVCGQDWTSDPFTLTAHEDRYVARGAVDMKGFLAACLAAAPAFAATELRRPIHLAFSYDEEVGCLGVPALIADLLTHEGCPALAIIGEPTGMRLGDRHRGFLGFRTRFAGHAAHSSDPSAGASAIYPAARFVEFLRSIGDGEGRGTDRTTISVGRIDGGNAINIVAAACEVLWEFRPAAPVDIHEIVALADGFLTRSLPDGVSQNSELLMQVPPLVSSANQAAVEAARHLGGRDPVFAMPFGTEAGFFAERGIPAVVCGPGEIAQAHQPDEWIAAEQLERADRFMEQVLAWAGRPADTLSPTKPIEETFHAREQNRPG